MIILYNKSPISWKSKMQNTIALLTAEAENYSSSTAAYSAQEVLYIHLGFLLDRLGLAQEQPRLIH